ncbi:unknown [Alistipes putredinis CAG:67]|nr:unknown [Alistipes putredinis CAG:67]
MCGFNPCLGFLVGNIHDNPELIEKQTAERHKTN